jgi:hypothetical protein
MFARLLAAFCLSNLVVLPVPGKDRPETGVVVYLSSAAAQPARPLEHMMAETIELMESAGYRVEFTTTRPTTDSALVVLELRGVCTAGSVPGKSGPLASTALSNGQVIPFASVDCTALSGVLASALAAEAPARGDFLYGRAMARLVAHELYHVLAKTTSHTPTGLTRACLHAKDLLQQRSPHSEF